MAMPRKEKTQAMPSKKSAQRPAAAADAIPPGKGSESAGGPYPPGARREKNADEGKGADWHGGQSVTGYHGPGQLGDQDAKPRGNDNSGSKE
jgi:hypothetical protein